MPEQAAAPQSAARRCLNCGAVLTGRYCANCSQAADVHVPSTRELLHEALEGITHSDSRLWRTLHLLWFKPGRLTQEFVAGRRASYLPPFRLYLVLSILFFLAASLSNTQVKFVQFDAATSPTGSSEPECDKVNRTAFSVTLFGRDWAPRIKHACNEIARDNGANLFHVAVGTAPKAMFIFLPLVAFLHMLMYWRPRHKYAEHLLFFLHVHAFFFSAMALAVLAAEAAGGVAGLEFHREPGRAFAMVLAGLHHLRHAAGVRQDLDAHAGQGIGTFRGVYGRIGHHSGGGIRVCRAADVRCGGRPNLEEKGMNRVFLVLGITLLAALAAAQDRTAPAANAEVYFISPSDGAVVQGPVTVRFGLKGMGIAPAGVKFDNTGHHHLLVDTDISELKLDAPLPATDKILHFGKGQTETTLTLSPGKHTLEIVLADYLHNSFDPPLHSKKITITVK